MRRLCGQILVTMGSALLALGQFTVALANGGDVPIDATEIPALVFWIGGGVVGALCLFYFIGRRRAGW
ncbi:MAG: hypothetical protein V3S51_07595, partial [Dehalococcoidia bacterium]